MPRFGGSLHLATCLSVNQHSALYLLKIRLWTLHNLGTRHSQDRNPSNSEQVPTPTVFLKLRRTSVVLAPISFNPENALDKEIQSTNTLDIYLSLHRQPGFLKWVASGSLEDGLGVRVDQRDDAAERSIVLAADTAAELLKGDKPLHHC